MYEIIWCVIFPHEVKKDLFYNGINRVAGGRKFMFMVLCLYIFERKNKEKTNREDYNLCQCSFLPLQQYQADLKHTEISINFLKIPL